MAMPADTRPADLPKETQRANQEHLRIRHLVRNLHTNLLRTEPIQREIKQLHLKRTERTN